MPRPDRFGSDLCRASAAARTITAKEADMEKHNLSRPMFRLLKASVILLPLLTAAPAFAQVLTPEPGPGGIPIAPGSAISTYTPGGIGPGGTRISPGPAAQGIPMYHPTPGGRSLIPSPAR
jgi:hypothetical protein